MDDEHNEKRLIKNAQSNAFRHKFIILNREWIVKNIAFIMGGRQYVEEAGAELNYIWHVYKTAVNQKAMQERVEEKQNKMVEELKLMPYNQKEDGVGELKELDISSDHVSDLPFEGWDIPMTLV